MTAPPAASPFVVAIDGPGGSGKSTVARAVALRLGVGYLDTGAMYRALTLRALQDRVDLEDAEVLVALADRTRLEVGTDARRPSVKLDGQPVTRAIREEPVTSAVSAVSAVKGVRTRLVRLQRDLIAAAGTGLVVEGRDIGTVVAPDAPVKIYLTASASVRARRRSRQLGARDGAALGRVESDLARRDAYDSGRAASPLTVASDAWQLDSSGLSAQDVVELVLDRCRTAGLPGVASA